MILRKAVFRGLCSKMCVFSLSGVGHMGAARWDVERARPSPAQPRPAPPSPLNLPPRLFLCGASSKRWLSEARLYTCCAHALCAVPLIRDP